MVTGSVDGDIHLVKNTSLGKANLSNDNPKIDHMSLGKTYPAHISYINQIEIT